MRILGIDPGSTATGYGVVERRGSALHHVAHGILRPPRGESLASRLAFVHEGILDLASRHSPDAAVVEQVFVSTNARSAIVLGQARGAALAALAGAGLSVSEMAARSVKKAVVGTGAASKAQVQQMVRRLLALEKAPPTDAADALAAAIGQLHAGRPELAGWTPRRGRSRRRALPAGSPR